MELIRAWLDPLPAFNVLLEATLACKPLRLLSTMLENQLFLRLFVPLVKQASTRIKQERPLADFALRVVFKRKLEKISVPFAHQDGFHPVKAPPCVRSAVLESLQLQVIQYAQNVKQVSFPLCQDPLNVQLALLDGLVIQLDRPGVQLVLSVATPVLLRVLLAWNAYLELSQPRLAVNLALSAVLGLILMFLELPYAHNALQVPANC